MDFFDQTYGLAMDFFDQTYGLLVHFSPKNLQKITFKSKLQGAWDSFNVILPWVNVATKSPNLVGDFCQIYPI